jgi:hypothetical protein
LSVSKLEYNRDKRMTLMTFHARSMGPDSWTDNLAQLPGKDISNTQSASSVAVKFDGPFGGLTVRLSRYDRIVLVCGGIGITPVISLLEHVIAHLDDEKYRNLKQIDLHWVVRGLAPLYTDVFGPRLMKILSNLAPAGSTDLVVKSESELGVDFSKRRLVALTHEQSGNNVKLGVSVYYTTRLSKVENFQTVSIVQERPNLQSLLQTVSKTSQLACVFVCGPASLSNSVSEHSRVYSNIHVHKETFGY